MSSSSTAGGAAAGTRPVALVAGASRGLGLLVARNLADRGYDLAICSRDEQSLAAAKQQIVADLPETQVLAVACDVSQEDAVRRLVERVEDELGPIEVAVHVAGIIQVGPWQATRHEHFEQAIDVMLWGPVNLALALLPRMTERGHGRFGVVTSIGGAVSVPRLLPYSVAKFGAMGLTEGLAAELAGTGVTATAIIPGLMRTGSHTRATFFGDPARQYAWFGPSASLPLVAIDAERAAAQMVGAVLAGKPVAHISPMSHVAARVHGVVPGLTVRAMGIASRLLPRGTDPEVVEGKEARRRLASPVVNALTTLGDRMARRTNEE